MSTLNTRAQDAHAALDPGRTAQQVISQAQNALKTAQAVQAAANAGALAQGAALLSGAAGALTLTGDPKLTQAAGVLTQLAGAASQVSAAIKGGMSPALAVARSAVTFIPPGTLRDLADLALQVVSYATASQTPGLTAAQGILNLLLSTAQRAAAKDPTASALVTIVRPFLTQIMTPLSAPAAAQAAPDLRKYALGAAVQTAADLAFIARARQRGEV